MFSNTAIGRALLRTALMCWIPAFGADVLLGDPVVRGGEVLVDVSVRAGSNESLAGLQFDLRFDDVAYRVARVELGAAADTAGKDAIYTDGSEGYTRLLVTGMNQNEIADGVVATIVLEPTGPMANSAIQIERPIFSDPFGNALIVGEVKQTELAMLGEDTEGIPAESSGAAIEPVEIRDGQATAQIAIETGNDGESGRAGNGDASVDAMRIGSNFGSGPAGGDGRSARSDSGNGHVVAPEAAQRLRSGFVERPRRYARPVSGSSRAAARSRLSEGPAASRSTPAKRTLSKAEPMRVATAIDAPGPRSKAIDPALSRTSDHESNAVLRPGQLEPAPKATVDEPRPRRSKRERWPGLLAGAIVFGAILLLRRWIFSARFMRTVVIAVVALAAGSQAKAAELSYWFGALDASGQIVYTIALRPAGGEQVGALQFDIEFNPDRVEFRRVLAGSSATDADKSANFNEISPGKVRVILAGLNRNVIGAGPIALVEFDADADPGTASIRVERAILSDPFGSAVPVTVSQDLSGMPIAPTASGSNDSIPLAAWGIAGALGLALGVFAWRILSPANRGRA